MATPNPNNRIPGSVTIRPDKRSAETPAVNSRMGRLLLVSLPLLALLALLGAAGWFYGTTGGRNARLLLADSLISSQHRSWARFIIGEAALQQRVAQYRRQFDRLSAAPAPADYPVHVRPNPDYTYRIRPINAQSFKGYLVEIADPRQLRVCVPGRAGKGETVSSMVARTGAILGVNGGGFVDPDARGNGSVPAGVVLSGGKVYYDASGDEPLDIVGIDKRGVLIAGKYRPSELLKDGVREAVTFAPRIIANGQGLIASERVGWGIAPRTVIAQKADGTLLFAVINGREPGYSLGASLYDVQNYLLKLGAVTAANLDGGSSSELVVGKRIVSMPHPFGERDLPTAFLLYADPAKAAISNPWAH